MNEGEAGTGRERVGIAGIMARSLEKWIVTGEGRERGGGRDEGAGLQLS
jgi:hypothetical protein